MSVTMRNPKNDDVRVVPDALEESYAARGFEKTTGSKPAKKAAAPRKPRKTAASKPSTQSAPPTE